MLFDNATNSCYEATVSLTDGKLLAWKHVPGVQPTMTIDEQVECEQAVLASPEFKAALKKHYGIDDTQPRHGRYLERGQLRRPRRTARAGSPGRSASSAPTRPTTATSGPIEGLRPVVDLNTMEVIRVEEYGHWPLPPGAAQLRRRPRDRLPRPTSSRWRSRSPRGRASRSRATR